MNRRRVLKRELHELGYVRWEIVPGLLAPARRLRGRATPVTFRMLGGLGKLGNQLWQVAATLAVAEARGAAPVLPDWSYRRWFSVPDRFFASRRLDVLAARDSFHYAGRYRPRHGRLFMQRWALIEPSAADLRRWFQPSTEAAAALEGLLPDGHLVAVHVRRGDYLKPSTFGYFRILPVDYYLAGVSSVAVPGTRVVIFSDDPAWCHAELAPRLEEIAPVTVVEGNPDWTDLFLISRCDRHVLSNSTYAWWGAFLSNDPEPVYPKRFSDDPNEPEPPHSAMYPPSWRALDL